MQKKTVLSVLTALALYLASYLGLTLFSPGDSFSYPTAQAQSQGSEQFGSTQNGDQSWLWLLPLLALPFLFVIFRSKDREDMDNEGWPYDQYSVGMKGGRSRRSGEEEEEEFL